MRETQEILKIARSLLGGEFQAPPAMVKKITLWVEAKIAAHDIVGLIERLPRVKSEYIEQLEKDIDEYKKIISRYPGVRIGEWKTITKKKFKLDLGGWRYLKRAEDGEGFDLAKEMYNEILVVLTRGKKNSSWHNDPPRILINARDIEFNIVHHELQHFAQFFLKLAISSGTSYFPNSPPGFPSKKIRDPKINQWLKKNSDFSDERELVRELKQQGIYTDGFHALDDVEFYTRLSDSVDSFKKIESWWPKIMLEKYDFKERFEFFVGVGKGNENFVDSTFKWFKKYSKGKWEKAVKELWKAVS